VIPSFWVSLEMVKLMKNHVKPRFWMVQPFNRLTSMLHVYFKFRIQGFGHEKSNRQTQRIPKSFRQPQRVPLSKTTTSLKER
jgi:hypothetical protein